MDASVRLSLVLTFLNPGTRSYKHQFYAPHLESLDRSDRRRPAAAEKDPVCNGETIDEIMAADWFESCVGKALDKAFL